MRLLGYLFVLMIICFASCNKDEPNEGIQLFTRVQPIVFSDSTCSMILAAEFQGILPGIFTQNIGFVYDYENDTPTLDDNVIFLPEGSSGNKVGIIELSDVRYDDTIYVRSFLGLGNELVYSLSTVEFIPREKIDFLEQPIPILINCGSAFVSIDESYPFCLPGEYEFGITTAKVNLNVISSLEDETLGKVEDGFPINFKTEFNLTSDESKAYSLFVQEPDNKSQRVFSSFRYIPNVGPQLKFTAKADFPGPLRGEATGFSDGKFGYVCGGYTEGREETLNDLWRYDPSADIWQEMTPYPEERSRYLTSFVTSNGIYVGLGGVDQDDRVVGSRSFFRYSPEDDSWSRIKDFPISGSVALSFVVDDIGYVGNLLNENGQISREFYRYDEDNNEWQRVADFPREINIARSSAIGFNNRGVVMYNYGITEMFSYDPSIDSWLQVGGQRSFDGNDGVPMVLQDELYFIPGRNAGVIFKFDEFYDLQNTLCLPPEMRRSEAVGFKIDDKFYLATGVEQAFNTGEANNPLSSVFSISLN